MNKEKLKQFKEGFLDQYENSKLYSIFAEYYDTVLRKTEYKRWQNYLLDLINHYNIKPNKILDLACGTGNMTIPLKKLGFDIDGLDNSESMLKLAQKKSKKSQLEISFYQESMTQFNLANGYDLIFSFNNSINYLLKSTELSQMIERVYNALFDSGLFIFDLPTENHVLKSFHKQNYFENFNDFAYLWQNHYFKKQKRMTSTLDFYNHLTKKVYRETHIQRIYTINELIPLIKPFFKEIDVFESFTLCVPKKHNYAYHVICRK